MVRVLGEDELRRLVGLPEAIPVVEGAFRALGLGRTCPPAIAHINPPGGEVHIKGGYIEGEPYLAIKVATGFPGNPARGLPAAGGLFLVLDAATGLPAWVLLDNGFLTDLRTGAAGAVAAEYLAPRGFDTVGVLGSGVQARYQVEALHRIHPFHRLLVHGRTGLHVEAYVEDMRRRLPIDVEVLPAEKVVRAADVLVTATAATEPLVRAEWIHPGLHITAMGSDSPEKRELEPGVLAAADLVVVDHLDQCLHLGELHHAVEAGVLRPGDVHATLGEVVAGKARGRSRGDEITVADLTGVGVQDAAIANEVCRRAEARGWGRAMDAP